MELNREQIIKALECCYDNDLSCIDCPFIEADRYADCSGLNKNALALIKELTEENERLKEDNEIKSQKRANIFEITNAFERGRADGVRKMHSMLCEGRVSNDNVVIVANQIAKEMLEGNNE